MKNRRVALNRCGQCVTNVRIIRYSRSYDLPGVSPAAIRKQNRGSCLLRVKTKTTGSLHHHILMNVAASTARTFTPRAHARPYVPGTNQTGGYDMNVVRHAKK